MKINLSPTYISDSSSARRQPIPIDVNLDPTANSITAPFKQSRQNGYISPIGANKSLSGLIVYLQGGSLDGTIPPEPPPPPPDNPKKPTGTAPLQVTNLQAQYLKDSNNHFTGQVQVTFDFDLTDPLNVSFAYIQLGLSIGGTTYKLVTPNVPYDLAYFNADPVHQSITLSIPDLSSTGVYKTYAFDHVEVATYSYDNFTNGFVYAQFLVLYTSSLPAPIITESDTTSAYIIATTNLETVKKDYSGLFNSEIIQEFVYPNTGLTPTQVDAAALAATQTNPPTDGWVQVGEPRTISPTSIFAYDGNHRYVRAYFVDSSGSLSSVSNYVEATPTALLPNNTLPPDGFVGAVSASFSNNGAGDDINISYTLPTIVSSNLNKPVSIKVTLTPIDQQSISGSFYHIINNISVTATGTSGQNTITVPSGSAIVIGQAVSGTGIGSGAKVTAVSDTLITLSVVNSGSVSGTINFIDTGFTIFSNLISSQFGGQFFSSYSGTAVIVSQAGVTSSVISNLSPSPFTRTDSLSSVTPTAVVSNVLDGYSVQFNFTGTIASSAQIYQFFIDPTSWIGSGTNYAIPDYLDSTVSSWSISSANQIVVSNLTAENGNFVLPSGTLPYKGYAVSGTNIPANTWITSISGTGPTYTLNLNNSLTQAPSGNIHIQTKVYDGIGPANVFSQYHSSIYVVVVFYSKYNTRSKNSLVLVANPTDPSISVISNAIQVGSGGAIYVGSSATTGSRIVLGPSGINGPDGSASYSGIFAFDYGSTSGSSASTAIITNPGANSYTFETVNAKIADWSVNGTQIQNTLDLGATNYVGLSATGPYSIWAGSTDSGGNSTANFSVTPTGNVSARNLSIYGRGTLNIISAIGNGSTVAYTVGSGSTPAKHYLTVGQSITTSGFSNANYNLSLQQIVSVTDTTFTVNGNATGTSGSGRATVSLISAGSYLSIMSDGTINASNVYLSGSLNVNQPSTFNSNINIGPAGYLIATGTNGTVTLGGAGIQAAKNGSVTTQISSTPIGDDGVTFATQSAYLGASNKSGAWYVSNNLISSKGIELDSSSGYITAYPLDLVNGSLTKNSLYGVRIYGGSSTGGLAISAGLFTKNTTTNTPDANFYVTTDGLLFAKNATISGTVTANKFTIDANNYWNDDTHNGNFRIGTASNATSPSYLSYDGDNGLVVYGKITATSGYIGSSTSGWIINSSNIVSKIWNKDTNDVGYLKLDASTDSITSYAPSTSAAGTTLTYNASYSGGAITSTTATAAQIATSTSFQSGLITSTGYTVLKTKKAFQVFKDTAAAGDMPAFSIDPDGTSTYWNNGNGSTLQNVSFTSINTKVIYLNTDDIIIGNSPGGFIYINGSPYIRNDTEVSGTHQYLRNIYIGTTPPTTGVVSGTGFIGDLYVTY